MAAHFFGVDPEWLMNGDGEPVYTIQPTEAKRQEYTSQARTLAELFDQIPEKEVIRRAKAYTKASQAILDELQATAPVSAGSEKLTA